MRTCAECIGGYCDECQLYDIDNGKPDIENCEYFINEEKAFNVVRCCNCKHSLKKPDTNNTYYLICNKKYGIQGTIAPDDYCSYGERKDYESNMP